VEREAGRWSEYPMPRDRKLRNPYLVIIIFYLEKEGLN
jgi:hypothetical protein